MQGPFAGSRLSGAQLPRLAPGSVHTATAEAPIPGTCPRCQTALTDPDGVGYCLRCGYCRSVMETPATPGAVQPIRAEADAPRLVIFWRALRQLPESCMPILLATLFLLPVCYFVDRSLAPNSRTRIIWSLSQVLVGFALIYASQFWAFLLLRARRERVGFLDTVFPSQLWRLTIHALPETAGPLCLCFGGSVTVLTAIVWIGSWGWLLEIDPSQDLPTTHVAEETSDFRHDYRKLKEAAASVRSDRDKSVSPGNAGNTGNTGNTVNGGNAVNTGNTGSTAPASPPRDTRPTTQCVVIGYLADKDGLPTSLVLATLRDGRLTYAGTVTNGVGKEEASALLKKLTSLASNTPLVGDVEVKALWVRPELFCEVHQSGYDAKGLLIQPRFKAIITD